EASTASQQEREDRPGHAGVKCSDPGLAAVEDMTGSKEKRKTEGRRPKPDAGGKRKLRVPAVSKLFFQTDNHKHQPIQCSPPPRLSAVQGDAGDMEGSGRAHDAQEERQCRETEQRALPKANAEGLARRQAVVGQGTLL